MSELLQKYREKAELSQQVVESYKALSSMAISHLRGEVRENAVLDKTFEGLIHRIKGADNLFQIQQLNREFASLVKVTDAWLKEKRKAAPKAEAPGFLSGLTSMFGGKGERAKGAEGEGDEGGSIEDAAKELLAPYLILLDALSKGAITLADDRESFYVDLKIRREKKFAGLKENDAEALSASLYNFFIMKSNESTAVTQEREELKKIIGSLAAHIQTLAISSENFGSKLENYSRQVAATTTLDEIRMVQKAILSDTQAIQKENSAAREKLLESEKRLRESAQRITQLETELEKARKEKSTDHLTQLFNRGYFDEKLKEDFASFARYGEPFCLIIFDVDHFKKFNDTYGHQAGDGVLQAVAATAKETMRASDTVARYGGEEFVVVVYKARLDEAAKAAENLREAVAAHEFVFKGEKKIVQVTISLGVAQVAKGDTPKSLIERADACLYEAKKQGRNRTVHAPSK
ncbi:MAG: diguanylate cyclase [Nitrospinae bacterium]|nr:diguanylate cyclase [Nitrospinota bacterium]MBF0634107.1 diguanylate cyclase [Nitrospinota bacterium]